MSYLKPKKPKPKPSWKKKAEEWQKEQDRIYYKGFN
jgi:hypothetical protein